MNILSIQSQVTFGHVGNAAAVFPLQRLGMTVWPVHTVLFSNHTGYPDWEGMVTPPETVAQILNGLERRGAFDKCDAVLTGYIGDPALGAVVADAVRRIRSVNPGMIYCCDPVMGDVGRGLYVREGVPDFMRDDALALARIITPNQFELEYLTGTSVEDVEDALAAARALLAKGPEQVLITSFQRKSAPPDVIEMLLVTRDTAWLTQTPRLSFPVPPNGSGDAVAALYLAHYLRDGDARLALEHATAAIFALMTETAKKAERELALVEAQDSFAEPSLQFEAIALT